MWGDTALNKATSGKERRRLNPCFGGRCGGTRANATLAALLDSGLNPCFGGRCGGTSITVCI